MSRLLLRGMAVSFGSNVEGLTVFVGEKECTKLEMSVTGSIKCLTPPGEGIGVTVTVSVGDYDRNLRSGPFGGHQAGHCGAASREHPYSDCAVAPAPLGCGVPLRGCGMPLRPGQKSTTPASPSP